MPENPPNSTSKMASKISRKSFLRATTLALASLTWIGSNASIKARQPKTNPDLNQFKTEEIAPGIFIHTGQHAIYTPLNKGDISNSGFIIGNEAVAVIDTGGTFLMGKALRNAIKQKTDRPIRYVINTHMHPDHVFGNAAFKTDQTEFIAHYKMARGLAARAKRYLAINKQNAGEEAFKGTQVILPTKGIKTRQTLNLGERELVLEPQPTAHTDNDLVITDTMTNTLFLGDLLFSKHCPALDGSILGWLKVIDQLSNKHGARVVPGHGPASMAWPEALKPQRRYLQTITDEVRTLIANGETLDKAMNTVALGEKDQWELFDDFHKRNIAAAFAELEWE